MAKRTFTLEDRYKAAAAIVATGSADKAAEQTGISPATLYRWKQDEDFQAICQEIRSQFGDEIKDNLAQIVRDGCDQIRDRINNGDYVLDKNGELKRKPMSGRDLTIATGTAFDKLRVIEGQPTHIVEHGISDRVIKLAHLRAVSVDPETRKLTSEQWWKALSEQERTEAIRTSQIALAKLSRGGADERGIKS